MQNLRYAFRQLPQSPAFTIIAIGTLALSIGVNTSMYSFMNTLMFADAPFPRPESIVSLNGQTPEDEFTGFSAPETEELRVHPTSAITSIAAFTNTMEAVALPNQSPEHIQGIAARADLFQVLETPPLLGRVFTAEECIDGKDTVALITEDYWRTNFGARPDALGQTLRIEGRIFTIIGVLPGAYSTTLMFNDSQYFRPLIFSQEQIDRRDRRHFGILARLAPDAQIVQALASLAPLSDRWAKDHPSFYPNYQLRIAAAGRVGGSANVAILSLTLGLAISILAIACANLANLQMARAAARFRSLAIRSALGASRWRLIKLQLYESMVISISGGILGLVIASWCNDLLGRNIQMGLNSTLQLTVDSNVLAFTAAISIFAGLGFGLLPAWLASRVDVSEVLKQQSRGSTGGKKQGLIRNTLVVGQIALSLTLLSVAGMMIQGLDRTINSRPNWDSESLLTTNVQIDESKYTVEQRRALFDAVPTRVARIPGVESSALASQLPTMPVGRVEDVFTDGQDSASANLPKSINYFVTPSYFKTLGIRLLEGSAYPDTLSADSVEQVIVNQTLAKSLWPNESAVGKRLGAKGPDGSILLREVIGVVSDVEDAIKFSEPATRLQFYTSLIHHPWTSFQIVLRGQNPSRFGNDLRKAVAEISPDLSARFVTTIGEMRQQVLHNLLVINAILLAFALLGLVLASVGIYGIVSNNVGQRIGEFAIRLALGAPQSSVLSAVLNQSLRLSAIGLFLGAIGSYFLGQALSQSLGPLIAQSQAILIGTGAAIFIVVLIASWFPARRATHVDPMEALRGE